MSPLRFRDALPWIIVGVVLAIVLTQVTVYAGYQL